MTHKQDESGWTDPKPTALLVLADGTVIEGFGLEPKASPMARSAYTPP